MNSIRIDDVKMGKFMSMILRHHPDRIGIKLDEHGWADVREFLAGINSSGRYIDMEILERIVAENNKKRYSFNDSRTKIRANQGHSIAVDVELTASKPPDILYHGTAFRFIDSIKDKGIIKQNRQYVHLSSDTDTAIAVGKRHGKPALLQIDAKRMFEDGYDFYLSVNKVWLCGDIPWEYIKIQDTTKELY